MRRDPRAYLSDVQVAASLITRFTEGKTLGEYSADPMLRSVVERQFEVIGEALAQLRRTYPELAERISGVRRIIDFRNVLAHSYNVVDDALVWQAIQINLRQLAEAVSRLLADLNADDQR